MLLIRHPWIILLSGTNGHREAQRSSPAKNWNVCQRLASNKGGETTKRLKRRYHNHSSTEDRTFWLRLRRAGLFVSFVVFYCHHR